MTVDEAIREWGTKSRRMGCVSAANWFCRRVGSFRPKRVTRYMAGGEVYEHVVCTDRSIVIDLAPYADRPRD